jgi:hypothetical protein
MFQGFTRKMIMKTKYCSKCQSDKPISDFAVYNYRRQNEMQCWCRNCVQEYQRLVRHNMTKERFQELWDLQNGKCAVCNKTFSSIKDIHIDHDHKCCPQAKSCYRCTRGLLCFLCNQGLGQFRDNIPNLIRALVYLIRYRK